MAKAFKLRNGATVEVAPGQDGRHSVGVVYNGRIEYLLYPPGEEGELKGLPRGGILGEGFDAIAMDDLFGGSPICSPEVLEQGIIWSSPEDNSLLDALRYAAGFTNTTQLGDIDLMATNENAFQTVEYYHGTPVGQMSDDQIFNYVRNIDAKLKELGGLGDGKAVSAHTVRLETEKEGLLRVVDARYEADTE